MYTLDTNTIIYYLKDDSNVVSAVRASFAKHAPIYASSITELELFSFPSLEEKEFALIEDLLRTIAVIPLDSQIARIAASLRRTNRIKVADSAVAATALFTGSTLLTRNTKDFKKIPALKILEV